MEIMSPPSRYLFCIHCVNPLQLWACRKGGQMCGGAGHVSGWGLLRGASLRCVVGGPARPRHVEKGRGASVVVGMRAWGHPGRAGDLGMLDTMLKQVSLVGNVMSEYFLHHASQECLYIMLATRTPIKFPSCCQSAIRQCCITVLDVSQKFF